MNIKNQEDILDQVILSIKSKRLEETMLQEAIDKLFNTKIQYVNQLNNLREDIAKLNCDKDDLKDKINKLVKDYDKQLEAIILKEEAITKNEKKLEESRAYLRKETERLNNEAGLLKKHASRLKSDTAINSELRQQLSRDNDKLKTEWAAFNKQNGDLAKTMSEYREKLGKVDFANINAVNNLKKSEELKQILNDRIAENKTLKEHLLNEKNTFVITQKKWEEDRIKAESELEIATEEANAQRDYFMAKLKLQQVLDSEIEIRRLRVEKLIREKNVAKELADLEREING